MIWIYRLGLVGLGGVSGTLLWSCLTLAIGELASLVRVLKVLLSVPWVRTALVCVELVSVCVLRMLATVASLILKCRLVRLSRCDSVALRVLVVLRPVRVASVLKQVRVMWAKSAPSVILQLVLVREVRVCVLVSCAQPRRPQTDRRSDSEHR